MRTLKIALFRGAGAALLIALLLAIVSVVRGGLEPTAGPLGLSRWWDVPSMGIFVGFLTLFLERLKERNGEVDDVYVGVLIPISIICIDAFAAATAVPTAPVRSFAFQFGFYMVPMAIALGFMRGPIDFASATLGAMAVSMMVGSAQAALGGALLVGTFVAILYSCMYMLLSDRHAIRQADSGARPH